MTLLNRFPPLLDKIRDLGVTLTYGNTLLKPGQSTGRPQGQAGLGGKGTFQLSCLSHNGSTVIVLHFGLFMQG